MAISLNNVHLTWDYDSNVTEGFKIYRSKEPFDVATKPLPIATIGPSLTSYSDTSIEPSSTYYYAVESFVGEDFRMSEVIVVNTGEAPAYDVWNPIDAGLNVVFIADASTVQTDANGNITNLNSNSVLPKYNFVSQSSSPAKVEGGAYVALRKSSYFCNAKPDPIDNSEATIHFSLMKVKSEYSSENPGAAPFVSVYTTMRFATYWSFNATGWVFSSAWFRNIGDVENADSTEVPYDKWAFKTSFANWTENLAGVATTMESGSTATKKAGIGSSRQRLIGTSMQIGGDFGGTLQSTFDYTVQILLIEKFTDELKEKLEGWAAWTYNRRDALPNDHPYKNKPPLKDY